MDHVMTSLTASLEKPEENDDKRTTFAHHLTQKFYDIGDSQWDDFEVECLQLVQKHKDMTQGRHLQQQQFPNPPQQFNNPPQMGYWDQPPQQPPPQPPPHQQQQRIQDQGMNPYSPSMLAWGNSPVKQQQPQPQQQYA